MSAIKFEKWLQESLCKIMKLLAGVYKNNGFSLYGVLRTVFLAVFLYKEVITINGSVQKTC